MLVDIIAAKRPDILRVASVLDAIQHEQKRGTRIGYRFIYTGSDIDVNLDKELFTQLNLDRPNVYLDINENTDAAKSAAAMLKYEKLLANGRPDMLLVTGKTNEALACAYIAKKNGNIKLGVINAGIRINSKAYTDNLNRLLLDSMGDYFFTSSHASNENLRKMGINDTRIFFTGNTHIDCVMKTRDEYETLSTYPEISLEKENYIVIILNKKFNTENPENLKNLLYAFIKACNNMPFVMIADAELENKIDALAIQAQNLHVIKRMGYLKLGWLLEHAKAVITDSNNIQEQCCVLDTPTLTLSAYTECPETIESGCNKLIGNNITEELEQALRNKRNNGIIPYQWDGKAAERIVNVLKRL